MKKWFPDKRARLAGSFERIGGGVIYRGQTTYTSRTLSLGARMSTDPIRTGQIVFLSFSHCSPGLRPRVQQLRFCVEQSSCIIPIVLPNAVQTQICTPPSADSGRRSSHPVLTFIGGSLAFVSEVYCIQEIGFMSVLTSIGFMEAAGRTNGLFTRD